jgi:hypothetical protein
MALLLIIEFCKQKINQEKEWFYYGFFPVWHNDMLLHKKTGDSARYQLSGSSLHITVRRLTVSGCSPAEPDSPRRYIKDLNYRSEKK